MLFNLDLGKPIYIIIRRDDKSGRLEDIYVKCFTTEEQARERAKELNKKYPNEYYEVEHLELFNKFQKA